MKLVSIILLEWKHFIRSPFKYVALVLFVAAALYGINNASQLYHDQVTEVERIKNESEQEQQRWLGYLKKGETGPADKPWQNVTEPFWAMWFSFGYHFKEPSPMMVYSVGQAEQYGFYKRVTFLSSPYDSDMVEEIGNPERQQSGMLDFSFVMLFLSPLLLLIFLYNLKGTEIDEGFYSLIQIQSSNPKIWLLARITFHFLVIWLVMLGLMLYASTLTPVFQNSTEKFWQLLYWLTMYLLIWTFLFGLVLSTGTSSISNTLIMTAIWLILVFVIPGIVHQWVSTRYPANLMTDFIDAQRDEREKLFSVDDSIFQNKLNTKFPEILNSVVYKDSTKSTAAARSDSYAALTNDLNKESVLVIEKSHREKNSLIASSFWYNPISLFQNKLNRISQTHFDDYQKYRDKIQLVVDNQIAVMVKDIWNDETIDAQGYLNYIRITNDN